MKTNQTIFLFSALGIGAYIFYLMKNPTDSKTTNKTTEGDSKSGKTLDEKLNFYFPSSKDEPYKSILANQKVQGGKALTDEQMIAMITAQMKESDPKKTAEDYVKELSTQVSSLKTQSEIDADKTLSPEMKKLSISREQVQKLLDSKETAIDKLILYKMIISASFEVAFASGEKGKKSLSKEKQLDEAKEFLGMCNY